MKRSLFVILAAFGLMFGVSMPANASTGAATSTASIPCSRVPGHYCAKIVFKSVSGGIRVTKTLSTGYTTGAGQAREYFRYTCNAGICYVVPSNLFRYGSRNTQLNVTRTFGNGGFFLPCGNRFGVDYRNPAVNAPGPGPVLFRVTCKNGSGKI